MISRFTAGDVRSWYRSTSSEIFLGDVLDETNSDSVGAGFARYAADQANRWVVAYDEVLVVTAGSFTVTSGDQALTAGPGEMLFLGRGTELVYSAGPTGAELAYVTYPLWSGAQRDSEHRELLDTFQPASTAPPDGLALMRRVWGPLERGESGDLQPFYDTLAADVVLETEVGTVHGKAALIGYFERASKAVEFNPFVRPLDYLGAGDRVVIAGDETFTVKDTGVIHQAPWAWIVDLRRGLVQRITALQDLTPIAAEIRAAMSPADSVVLSRKS